MSAPRHAVVVLALGAALVWSTACSSETARGSKPGSEGKPASTTTLARRAGVDGTLVIGALAPLSGSVAPIADAFTTPVKLGVDEMNLAGGVGGNPVVLVFADDGSDTTIAETSFTKLIDTDHADAIIGPSSSEIAAELIPRARQEEVVLCSGSNSSGVLSSMDSGGYYFRTAPPDNLQADALAQLVVAEGHQAPVILAVRDSYGVPFGKNVLRRLRALGAKQARLVDTPPDGDPGAAVTKALTTAPDAIVLIGFPATTAGVIRALAAAGKGPNQIATYGSDGLQAADLGALADPANPAIVAGMKGTTPAGSPAGIVHPFNDRMFAAGVEPFFSAAAYDCTMLVGLAAVAARSDDPAKIRDHFAANLRGKFDCATFAECRTILDAKRTIHYRGASSSFDDWNRSEPATGAFDVWTLGLDARPTIDPATSQIKVP